MIHEALPETWEVDVLRAAYQKARDGDRQLLKFFVSRILPRERLVTVDLPATEHADGPVEALAAILRAVADGKISPTEGAAMTTIVSAQMRALEVADVVKRVDELEASIRGRANEPIFAPRRASR